MLSSFLASHRILFFFFFFGLIYLFFRSEWGAVLVRLAAVATAGGRAGEDTGAFEAGALLPRPPARPPRPSSLARGPVRVVVAEACSVGHRRVLFRLCLTLRPRGQAAPQALGPRGERPLEPAGRPLTARKFWGAWASPRTEWRASTWAPAGSLSGAEPEPERVLVATARGKGARPQAHGRVASRV